MARAIPLWAIAVGLGACGGAGGVATPPPPSVASLTLSQSAATLAPGQTVTLVATVRDASGTPLSGHTVSWTTNMPSVAAVSSSGLVTANAPGSATITAASEGQTANATITVAAVVVPVASVTLNQATAGLVSGQSVTLTTTARDASGNVLTGRGVTWNSSALSVATVDGNGTVTGVAVGNSSITASVEGINATAIVSVAPGAYIGPLGGTASAFSGNVTITIPAGALTSALAITLAQVTNPLVDPKLVPGTAYDFGPTGTVFTQPVTVNIRYDPAMLAGSATPALFRMHRLVGTTWTPLGGSTVNTTTHVVTALTPSFSTYAVLEIILTVRSIALSPANGTVFVGATRQMSTTFDADVGANTALTWTSSNIAVATVSATGVVTGVAAGGPVTITARSVLVPTVTATAIITVSVSPPLTQWTSAPPAPGEPYSGTAVDIWSTASGDAFAVLSDLGIVYTVALRRNGLWQPASTVSFGMPSAVGGFGNEVWLATQAGTIGRWDGTQFVVMPTPPGVGYIEMVVGTGPGEAWATAEAAGSNYGAIVLHLQNGTWTRLPDPPFGIISGIAVNGSTIVAYAGARTITSCDCFAARWNGASWVTWTIATSAIGTSSVLLDTGELLAVFGNRLTSTSIDILRLSDSSMVYEPAPALLPEAPSEGVNSIVRCGSTFYAGTSSGGRVLRRDPGGWVAIAGLGEAVPGSTDAMVHCGADGVLRVSGTGVIARWTGTTWTMESYAPTMSRLAVVSPTEVYATAGNGTILRWDGSVWARILSNYISAPWRDLAVASDGTIFAMTTETPARIYRRQGGIWSIDLMSDRQLRVWAWSSSFALAASSASVWQRWNGTAWSPVSMLSDFSAINDLNGSGPDFAVAVGSRSLSSQPFITHWNGTAWQAVTVPAVGQVFAVTVVSPTLAFAIAETGMLRWNGVSWTVWPFPLGVTPTSSITESISAISANEVYANFGTPQIWLFDGTSWRIVATSPRPSGDVFGDTFYRVRVIPGFGAATGVAGLAMFGLPAGGAAGLRIRRP